MKDVAIVEGEYIPTPLQALRDAVDCYVLKLGDRKDAINWRWVANDVANMVTLAAAGKDYDRYKSYVGDRARDASLLRELRRKEGARYARRVWREVCHRRLTAQLFQRLTAKQKG